MSSKRNQTLKRCSRRYVAFTFKNEEHTHFELCASKVQENCSLSLMGVLREFSREGLPERGYVLDTNNGECTEYSIVGGSFVASAYEPPRNVVLG